MIDMFPLATAALSGGGMALLGQWGAEWVKGRHAADQTSRTIDAQLEEHRDNLTFDLLKAAREEVAAMRHEVAAMRADGVNTLHFEEALDHLDALLNSINDAERNAAERRARAFMRRMRPEVGDLRNTAQTVISTRRVASDIGGESA